MIWTGELIKLLLKKLLAHLGYSIHRLDIEKPTGHVYFSLTEFLCLCLERTNNFLVVQIGANDGVTFDPIREFISKNRNAVSAILVEPMADAYHKLVENYKDFPGVIKLNVAIHNSEKEMVLYKVDPTQVDRLPEWAGGMASFNSSHHKLTNTPGELIRTEKVKCMTLDELINNYHIHKIDLLQIDTEGYDAAIIRNIAFNKIKPGIIRFEHGLKDGIMAQEDFSNLLDFLNGHGYQIIIEDYDATAYQPGLVV